MICEKVYEKVYDVVDKMKQFGYNNSINNVSWRKM